jgi:L-ascorbate metabolism protein UlaG (beta-lactamase superfamily)
MFSSLLSKLKNHRKVLISVGMLIGLLIPTIILIRNNSRDDHDDGDKQIKITHINRACVLIEYNGTRIYIDPYLIPQEYEDMKADAILITHDHEDHYSPSYIELIKKSSTEFIGPSTCRYFLERYGGTSYLPHENGTVQGYEFQTVPMFTIESNVHPRSLNWLGYILEIGGISIFHAGDSDLIPEYDQYLHNIDVALIPVTESYPMMVYADCLQFVNFYNPRYLIPIHIQGVNLFEFKTDVETNYPNTTCIIEDFPFILDPIEN